MLKNKDKKSRPARQRAGASKAKNLLDFLAPQIDGDSAPWFFLG